MTTVQATEAEQKFEQLVEAYRQVDRTKKWDQTTAIINFAYVQAAQEDKSYFGRAIEFFQSEALAAGSSAEKVSAMVAMQETVFGPQASRVKLNDSDRVNVVNFIVSEAAQETNPVQAKQIYSDLFTNLSRAERNDQRNGDWNDSIVTIAENITQEDVATDNPKMQLMKLFGEHTKWVDKNTANVALEKIGELGEKAPQETVAVFKGIVAKAPGV